MASLLTALIELKMNFRNSVLGCFRTCRCEVRRKPIHELNVLHSHPWLQHRLANAVCQDDDDLDEPARSLGPQLKSFAKDPEGLDLEGKLIHKFCLSTPMFGKGFWGILG